MINIYSTSNWTSNYPVCSGVVEVLVKQIGWSASNDIITTKHKGRYNEVDKTLTIKKRTYSAGKFLYKRKK